MTLCESCDRSRIRDGKRHLVGRPCDICNSTMFDYLGRLCRHCSGKDA